MFKLVLEKAEEPEIKLPTSVGSLKKQETSKKKKIYFCFIDYAKAFDCVDHNKLWKILKRDGHTRPPDLPLEKSVCRSRRNRTGHGTTDWFQIGKEYLKAINCRPAYLTYMQSTSREMQEEEQAGIKMLGEISVTSYVQMTPPLWQKVMRN